MARRRHGRHSKLFRDTLIAMQKCHQQLIPVIGENRIDFGWGPPTASIRPTPEGSLMLYVSVGRDWLATVYQEGLAVLCGELTLSVARVTPRPDWQHETWLARTFEQEPRAVTHLGWGLRAANIKPKALVTTKYIVRHGGVACAASTSDGALANCILAHERNLNLEPSP